LTTASLSTRRQGWKGLSQLQGSPAGHELVGLTCRNPAIQLMGYIKRVEVLEVIVCWGTVCGVAFGRDAVTCDDEEWPGS